MVGVEGFLLVDDVLEFVEEGGVEVAGQFGEGEEEGHSFPEVDVSVDVVLIELLDDQLLKFRTGNVAEGEG